MDLALIASASLMGLLGAPHCSAMCGAPCGALMQRCGGPASRAPLAGFMTGRLLGYIAAGAAVAAGVALISAVGTLAPALRPLWTMLHVATLALGAWMLLVGALPPWMGRIGQAPLALKSATWQPVAGPMRGSASATLGAGLAGTLWFAMPCGLLQSALIVAALASTPWQGATAMAAFALSSSLGLVAWPLLAYGRIADQRLMRWVVRASGALLLGASGWALGHGLWQTVAALCMTR